MEVENHQYNSFEKNLWRHKRMIVDILKEFQMENDINEAIQICRPTHFGHESHGKEQTPTYLTALVHPWTSA